MSNRRRIVHLTSAHQPLDPRIFQKECRSAVEAGHEVVFVAPHDRDEMIDGVRIRAVPRHRGRRARMTRTIWRVYRAALAEDADLFQFHDPDLIPVGLLLKLRGRRVVYDVHEDVPLDILSKEWIRPRLQVLVARGAAAAEAIGGRVLDGIVAATPAIARRFPAEKTALVQNFARIEDLPTAALRPYDERPGIVAYVGVIAASRGAREMVQAMALMPASLDLRLALAGDIRPPALETELQQIVGRERVDCLGWQSRSAVGALLGRSRVGLLLLHPLSNYLESQPIKLFEYMLAGVPVVASDFPLLRRIVEGAGCGLLVDPLDPAAIAAAIRWLVEHPREAESMGKRGQEVARARYNWASEARTLLAFYEERLAGSPGLHRPSTGARMANAPREDR
jgi:glycosyltransferase involved in cell wall biosynthesis